MHSPHARRNAFTLIELLVVIGIIALLAALVFPALSSALAKSKRSYCLNNVSQLMKASVQFSMDNKGWLPYGRQAPNTASVVAKMNDIVTNMVDGGQMTELKTWFCPADKTDGGGKALPPGTSSTTFESVGNCSYAYLFGLGDKTSLPSSTTPVFCDESDDSDRGAAPTALKDLADKDNHGEKYRNVVYFDSHAVTLITGKASESYRESLPVGDPSWAAVQWTD